MSRTGDGESRAGDGASGAPLAISGAPGLAKAGLGLATGSLGPATGNLGLCWLPLAGWLAGLAKKKVDFVRQSAYFFCESKCACPLA